MKLLLEKFDNILNKKNVTYQEILEILKKETPEIIIERKKHSKTKWGSKSVIPFHYGEIPSLINPADGMGWDVLAMDETDLKLSGIVEIHENANKIPPPYGNKPGNHKLIFSKNGKLTEDQICELMEWFGRLPTRGVFKDPIFLEEGWEKAEFKNYKLTHVKDARYHGIAVGGVAKRDFERLK